MTITVQVGIKKVPVATMDDVMPPATMPDLSDTEELMVHFFYGHESYCVHESVSVGSIDACRVGLSKLLRNADSSCRNNPLFARFLSELQVFLDRIQKQNDDIKLVFPARQESNSILLPKTKADGLFKEAFETVRHIKHIRQGKFLCLSSVGVTVACTLLVGCLAAINSDFLTHCLPGPIAVSVVLAAGIACAIAGAVMWNRSLDKYRLFASPQEIQGTNTLPTFKKVAAQ